MAKVNSSSVSNDDHQNVGTNLYFLDEVLVVEDCYLEVVAVAKLLKLILKVCVQFVHAATQTVQKVLVRLRLEFNVFSEVAKHF